jgi:hypothetical protein
MKPQDDGEAFEISKYEMVPSSRNVRIRFHGSGNLNLTNTRYRPEQQFQLQSVGCKRANGSAVQLKKMMVEAIIAVTSLGDVPQVQSASARVN